MRLKASIVTIILSMAFLAVHCKSGETKLEKGETEEMTNDNGDVTGTRVQTDDNAQEYRFGSDGTSPPNRTVFKNGDQITKVVYDPNKDGNPEKQVDFVDGRVKKVTIFDPATKAEKTSTVYNVDKKPIYTDIVTMFKEKRYKKRVYYKADGSIDESKIEQLEGPESEAAAAESKEAEAKKKE